jgi:hypothetical protein
MRIVQAKQNLQITKKRREEEPKNSAPVLRKTPGEPTPGLQRSRIPHGQFTTQGQNSPEVYLKSLSGPWKCPISLYFHYVLIWKLYTKNWFLMYCSTTGSSFPIRACTSGLHIIVFQIVCQQNCSSTNPWTTVMYN